MNPNNMTDCCERSDITLLTKAQINQAIKDLRLVPFFHPLISSTSGKVQGVEVLARISDPALGILGPEKFIEDVEAPDITLPFTFSLMEKVIPVMDKIFPLKGKKGEFIISFNVPPNILSCPDLLVASNHFIGRVPDYVRLVLELTERKIFSLDDVGRKNIHELKDAGAQLWLDDFGTGYSGFLSLKTGVFDGIKIPREFVCNEESPASTMLRQSITRIGKDLNMTVVAEGVEQRSQVEMLSTECIDYLQGYYFSQPLSASDFLIYADKYLQVN